MKRYYSKHDLLALTAYVCMAIVFSPYLSAGIALCWLIAEIIKNRRMGGKVK